MDISGNGRNNKPVITIRDMTKVYQMGEHQVRALNGVSLDIYEGDFVSIMGPSGSGKSTLMNMLGALDQPTTGTYLLDDTDVSHLSDDDLADIRNRKIGFVFQNFNLLSRTPALQQVELPLIYSGKGQRRQLAQSALERVGLGDRIDHKPSELSGGQQQRVAIARALVNEPAIILADEPTGNLDSKSGTEVMELFQELNKEQGITVIFVTHDPWIARHTRRVITLADGKIVRDETIDEPLVAGEAKRPSDTALF
jgi:putative ABC transport system ATP-binding protein